MDLEGWIVEFIDSGALRLGYVRKTEQRRIQIVDQRGRHSSVPASRVVVVHGPAPEEDFPAAANRIQERVQECVSQIDASLLWESVHSQRREFTVSELAEAYFGRPAPENESATYRKLLSEPLFFRRSGTGFEARSEEQVSAEKLRMAREEEKVQSRREILRVLGRALEAGAAPEGMTGEEAWPRIMDSLERWLRKSGGQDIGDALEKLVGEARSRETAYDVLARFGRIPPTEDRFLLVRGISAPFPREVVEASRRLDLDIDMTGRSTCEAGPVYAIDDEYTVEVDDALTVAFEGGETVVGIHIADVSSFVSRDDPLDREAQKRSATIYLPNVSVLMLPPRLSADLASLVENRPRPALSVEARFSDEGELRAFRLFRSAITVTDRIEYGEADLALAEGDIRLGRLHAIAECLRRERVAQGAQTHKRPDIKVHARDGAILVERLEADTPSRLIVSEMMILANRLAAAHAATSGIPIIFRTQESPKDPRPETEGLPEVMQFELLRRNFRRSRLSLHPSPHAGLGLPCYTQMSSPIRRYADLVTQRQFSSALEGRDLPYEREELLELMTTCEAQEVEIRRLEQSSTAWWLLTYLARECMDKPLEAVVVDTKGTVELTGSLVRSKLKGPEDLEPGDTVTVRIESIDPEHGLIRLEADS